MGFLFQVKAISIIGDFTLVYNKTLQIQSKTQLLYPTSVYIYVCIYVDWKYI